MSDNAMPEVSSPAAPTPNSPDPNSSAVLVVAALTLWAKERAKWLEVLVFQAVNIRRNLTDHELDVVFDILEVESGLKESSTLSGAVVRPTVNAVADFQTLSLKELSHVEGVNALASGQRLVFHEKLTIFFGENGSGKSGYARVLKRIAGARGAEELIPNVFVSSSAPPRAEVVYALDQQEKTLTWNNESGKEPLSAIRVFDGRAAAIHLDEDLSYSYIPRELDSFDYVQDALERVRKRLESSAIRIRHTATEFPNSLRPGSMAFRVVTADSVADHAAYAESLSALTGSEIGELKALPQDIEALKSGSIAAELRLRVQRVRLLSAIAVELEKLSAFDPAQYSLAVTELGHAVALERSVSSEAFEGANIPKLLEPAWRAFIAAAESYIKDGVGEGYPREEQDCIYCRQPLQSAAVDLVRKYRDFSNSTAQEAVIHARRRVAELAEPLLNLEDTPFREARSQLELSEDALLLQPVELYQLLRSSRESVMAGEALHAGGGASQTAALAAALRKEVYRVEVMIKQLSEQESSRLETVRRKELRLAELSDRVSLADLIGNLRIYDANLKLLARAELELANCRSYQRALTLTAKEVSEALLNESFEARFRDECDALNAPEIKLAFPGRMGKVIRQKGVCEGHKLSTILSEGEQKVVALADFLAELSLRPEKVTVVFDDPVTSLDCRRIREVSRRIAKLVGQTQVVIFTHNIVFVAELMDAVDAKNFAYYDVRRAAQPGFISMGTNPRIDTFNKLRTRINSAIGDAKKLANAEEQRKQVELIYDHIRSACEVLVEQELLKKLTERYLPNLKMTVLAKIKYDRLEPAARIILEIFEKSCRYIPGHSQPLETLGVVPTLVEVEQDWKKLQQAKDEHDR